MPVSPATASTAEIGPAAADHRAILEDRPLRRAERVEARRHEPVQRGRELLHAFAVRRLPHERDELLDEERVATAAFEHERDERVVGLAAGQRLHERDRRLVVEGLEVQHERVVTAALGSPVGVESGSRGRDEHERGLPQPAEQPFAHLEQLVVGPVQVREREHERAAGRERFEERDHRPDRVVARPQRVDTGPGNAFHHVHQTLDDAVGLGRVGSQVQGARHGLDHLRARVRPARHAFDAARVPERLTEGAEHVGVAVRNALTGERSRAELAPRDLGDLLRETALADARVAEQHDDVRVVAVGRHPQHVTEGAELGIATHERRALARPAPPGEA